MVTGPYSAVRDFVTVCLYPVVVVARSDDSPRPEEGTGTRDEPNRFPLRSSRRSPPSLDWLYTGVLPCLLGGVGRPIVRRSDNTVSVIDPATNSVVDTIAVGSQPDAVAVDPVTDDIYVTNDGDNTCQ